MLDDVKTHWHAQKSFLFFCEEILGYKEDLSVGYFNLTKTHKKLCSLLEGQDNKSKMFLMPRHSIKSNIITVGYSLWRTVKDPNIRILIYSDSATKAQGFLYGIKTHIEGKAPNSLFRRYYPNWETDPHKGGTYNESRVIITARKHSQKEPNFDTGGIESSKIGMHYDLIIFDDIVSDLNTTTKAQMDKIHDCYKKSLSLLKPGGEVIIVGTRWHFGDAYGRIIDENKEKQNFEIFIRDAEQVEDGKLLFESIGLDKKFLDYQRNEQGSYIFSCLYRNNPVDDETALFKTNNFVFYEPSSNFHKNMFVTGTCDPAGEGDDYTAITVVAQDKDRNYYVLDAVNDHLKPDQIVDHIIKLNYKWGFDRFGVERNFFKGMFEKEFRLAEKEHRNNPNYKTFDLREDLIASAKQKTFNRVLALQPIHERRQLFLPGKSLTSCPKVFSDLAFQMLQFTIDGSKSPHDDLIISLAYHIEISIQGGEPEVDGPPKNSPAWLEQNWIQDYNKMQRRLPRRMRRPYQSSLS